MTSNIISQRTLKVLYGNNHLITDNDNYKTWVKQLPESFRTYWNIVPEISLKVTNYLENGQFSFYYNQDRYNPFQIDRNFNTAIKLLEECYELKDSIQALHVEICEQKELFMLADELDKLAEKEDGIIKQKIYSISNARSFVSDQIDNKSIFNTIDGYVIEGEAEPLELEIIKQKRNLNKANRLRIEKEMETPNSPYNKTPKLERLKAKYANRFTDLVMLIEAIKQGLLLIHNIEPEQIQIDSELLENAILEYKNYPKNLASELKIIDKDSKDLILDFENDIKTYLWKTAVRLQQYNLQVDDYVARFSVVRDGLLVVDGKRIVDSHPYYNPYQSRLALEKALQDGKLNIVIPENHFHLEENVRILGITAEIILKNTRHIQTYEIGKISMNTLDFDYNYLLNSRVRFHIEAPQQLTKKLDPNSYSVKNKGIVFNSTPNFIGQSLTGNSTPVFYGKNFIENYNPIGEWKINIDTAMPTAIDDILICLHVKSKRKTDA